MRDFSKWEAMWDAYYAQGFSGGAVPGSAASICWNIGLPVGRDYHRLQGLRLQPTSRMQNQSA